MSITTEIQRLRTNVNNIRQNTSDILEAISNKGVTVPAGSTLDDCAGLISQIGTGGGEYVEIGDRTYSVEQIGLLKWTTENLELKCVNIGGDFETTTPNAWYYNNDSSYGNKYGLLYNYGALSVITSYLSDGWRIPDNGDLTYLVSVVGGGSYAGVKLKSQEWNGTDNVKFNMLPGGMAWGSFLVFGQYGYLWSTNKYRWNFKPSADVTSESISPDYAAFSIRLCKDA